MPSSVSVRGRDVSEISAPEREQDVLRLAVDLLRDRIPESWTMIAAPAPGSKKGWTVASITGPDGSRVDLLLAAVTGSPTPRDVPVLIEQLATVAPDVAGESPVIPVVAARYLTPSVRTRVRAMGAGYVDATGNLRITAERPALLLADRGADSDPWRGPGRPLAGLRGEPAARIARALADFTPPYTVPELAKKAGTSTGATYRVVEFLEREDLLTRKPYGPVSDVRWRDVLMRWSQEYSFGGSNSVSYFVEARGPNALMVRLRDSTGLKYVVSGSRAVPPSARIAAGRLTMIYADDPAEVADALGLRPIDTAANVVLAAPRYDIVFERAESVEGLQLAALSQVAVDLATGPGRSPNEADALLDWLEANESDWRR
jgi:hypothetical protein